MSLKAEPTQPATASNAPMHAIEKIKSIDELSVICAEARNRGETVVLCHGVFDLLHMGHVRHLDAARQEGTILVVTVTADQFVNRGPGRPAFNDAMRAEMLGSLQAVSWVGINHGPSAETVIRALQPHVYVKGSDYEKMAEDVTGKIFVEKEAVEAHGGRIVFTHDITFSSSNLLNRHFNIYNPQLKAFLEWMRTNVGIDPLLELIEKIKNYRVVLVGDSIIDEYQFAVPMNKSAKEDIIAARFESQEVYAGGVLAAANHVADFCREVVVLTTLGREDSREEMIRETLAPNVRLLPVFRNDGPTTRKLRFVDPSYIRKMFEVYFFNDAPPSPKVSAELEQLVNEHVPGADVVIVTDFGHGMIGPDLIARLREKAAFLAANAQTNAGNQGFNLVTKYSGADYVCIDEPEARLAIRDRYCDKLELPHKIMQSGMEFEKMVITHGKHGCVVVDRERELTKSVPAFVDQVVDTVGAGDAFLTITSPLVCAGGNMEEVGLIGNAVGALKVGIVGHRKSVDKVSLVKFLTSVMK